MPCLSAWCPVIFHLLVVATRGCVEPTPNYLTEMDETDGPGTLVLTMSDPPASTPSTWTFSVSSPVNNAAYVQGHFQVVQNTSDPSTWRIVLTKALDVEMIKKDTNMVLPDLTLDLQCSNADTNSVLRYERTVVVRAISEFIPVFNQPLPRFNICEDSSIGTMVVSLKDHVTDEDVQNNGQTSDIRKFSTQPFVGGQDHLVSGDDVFGVTYAGDVLLLKPLDYEDGGLSYGLNVTVEDTGGLTSWSQVTIDVINANDNPPVFVHRSVPGKMERVTEYSATVEDYYTGPINLLPGPIHTKDLDNDVISYYIKTGYPDDYGKYIDLDISDGTVTLTHPANDTPVSHFTLVIEARDGSMPKRIGESKSKVHTATASLLVFISGRDASIPGNPRSGSSSTIASVNSDVLFISVIALSTLSFLLIVAVIVLCCKIKKKRNNCRNEKFPGVERCNSLRDDRKPSDWSIQMRPVDRNNSEKAFMRSLSRNAPYVNEGFVNDKSKDEIFVTGITPYTDVRIPTEHEQTNNNSRPFDRDVISSGIMPYNQGSHGVVGATEAARHSASTLPRNTPLNPSGMVLPNPSTIAASTHFSSNRTTPPNVSNSFESLDLLTSVKPIAEDDTRPVRIIQNNVNNKNNNDTMKSSVVAGTTRSLTSTDVMNELDQIIFNENQYSSDRGEKVTHFTNESTTDRGGTLKLNDSRRQNQDGPEEGITSFARDHLDYGVMPFDPNSKPGDVEMFMFPGEERHSNSPGSQGNPFKGNPVLNSADVYYRQNNKSNSQK